MLDMQLFFWIEHSEDLGNNLMSMKRLRVREVMMLKPISYAREKKNILHIGSHRWQKSEKQLEQGLRFAELEPYDSLTQGTARK